MSTNPGQYCVRLEDGEELLVDIDFDDGAYVARVGDHRHRLALRRGSSGQVIVDVDDRSYCVRGTNGSTRLVGATHEAPMSEISAWSAGESRLRNCAEPRVVSPGSSEAERASLVETVASPLTGLVVSIEVEVGERVARGQTLLVVEAMKMENRITAPCEGCVTTIDVELGQTVRLREPLVSLAPAVNGPSTSS